MKMDWFKENKIPLGVMLSSIITAALTSGLFTTPKELFFLGVLSSIAGFLAGTGANIKSDKQQKVEGVLREVTGEIPVRRITDK